VIRQAQMREFALIGARARLQELRAEEARLRQAFPELFRNQRTGATRSGSNDAAPGRRRGRRKMSSAERKAVSERMRKYWADRRKKAGQK
jgi:hypothetical protein